MSLSLEMLPDVLAICRLAPDAAVPSWAAQASRFITISRTPEELSITTVQDLVPPEVRSERNYRALRVRGTLPLDLIGVLAAIAVPLADAGLSIFAISTFETDYVLIRADDMEAAVRALEQAGHRVEG
ncbi:MAG TPA: ACT domain-containing protein [Gemmatimonadales bacterium]|nr:ACT domain-containing protein [Gemmatimonadales bacterium]